VEECFASEDEFQGTTLDILAGPLETASDLLRLSIGAG
jgi:hypothetical protein